MFRMINTLNEWTTKKLIIMEKRIDRNRDSALFLHRNVSSCVLCMLCIVYFIENTKSLVVGLWQASNCRHGLLCVCDTGRIRVCVYMWACVWVRAGYSNINSSSNSSYRVAISYTRTYYHMHKYEHIHMVKTVAVHTCKPNTHTDASIHIRFR